MRPYDSQIAKEIVKKFNSIGWNVYQAKSGDSLIDVVCKGPLEATNHPLVGPPRQAYTILPKAEDPFDYEEIFMRVRNLKKIEPQYTKGTISGMIADFRYFVPCSESARVINYTPSGILFEGGGIQMSYDTFLDSIITVQTINSECKGVSEVSCLRLKSAFKRFVSELKGSDPESARIASEILKGRIGISLEEMSSFQKDL